MELFDGSRLVPAKVYDALAAEGALNGVFALKTFADVVLVDFAVVSVLPVI